MRVRGLKLKWKYLETKTKQSHPVRVRGLKHSLLVKLKSYTVAPRAGAWVETHKKLALYCKPCVAPRAGAWVETLS